MKLLLKKLPEGTTSLTVFLACSKEDAKLLKESGQTLPPKMPFKKPVVLGEIVDVEDTLGHRICGAYPGFFEQVQEKKAPPAKDEKPVVTKDDKTPAK